MNLFHICTSFPKNISLAYLRLENILIKIILTYSFPAQVVMEVHPLLHQLDSLLAGEVSRPRPGAAVSGQATISPGMRDGSAHVLRCLKVWYDLPSDVFHTALANIDTFLAKMKVSQTTTRASAPHTLHHARGSKPQCNEK